MTFKITWLHALTLNEKLASDLRPKAGLLKLWMTYEILPAYNHGEIGERRDRDSGGWNLIDDPIRDFVSRSSS